jgi:hypothetical protein
MDHTLDPKITPSKLSINSLMPVKRLLKLRRHAVEKPRDGVSEHLGPKINVYLLVFEVALRGLKIHPCVAVCMTDLRSINSEIL